MLILARSRALNDLPLVTRITRVSKRRCAGMHRYVADIIHAVTRRVIDVEVIYAKDKRAALHAVRKLYPSVRVKR